MIRNGNAAIRSTIGTITAASGSSTRGKYTFVTSARFATRAVLDSASAEAKYCIGTMPAAARLGNGVLPCGKFANFPNTIEYTSVVIAGTRSAQVTPRNVCL